MFLASFLREDEKYCIVPPGLGVRWQQQHKGAVSQQPGSPRDNFCRPIEGERDLVPPLVHYGFHRPAPVAFSAAPIPAALSASAGQWPASLVIRWPVRATRVRGRHVGIRRYELSSRAGRKRWRLAPGAAELCVPIMQSSQQFVAACAGPPRQGILQQPLEGSVAVRLLLRWASALFVERLQEPFQVRAH